MVAPINNYPEAVIRTAEMNQISQTMSQINHDHEERKKETDKINRDVYNG